MPVVDSLKPIEIIVSFSAFCHWNEPPQATTTTLVVPTKDDVKPPGKEKPGRMESRMAERESAPPAPPPAPPAPAISAEPPEQPSTATSG